MTSASSSSVFHSVADNSRGDGDGGGSGRGYNNHDDERYMIHNLIMILLC